MLIAGGQFLAICHGDVRQGRRHMPNSSHPPGIHIKVDLIFIRPVILKRETSCSPASL
ncbi:hypothetical protein EAM_0869 [Erwinia amylovora ATCC 49946]|nr:hypothetical protein EAM_0869 [Erwinia amylovora ATCC 49946]